MTSEENMAIDDNVKIVYRERGPGPFWAAFTMILGAGGLCFGLWLGRQIEPNIVIDGKICQSLPNNQAPGTPGQAYELKIQEGYTGFLCRGKYRELVPDAKPLVDAVKEKLNEPQ